MKTWALIAFPLGGLIGWYGGMAYGWLMGNKDCERRWSDAVNRKPSIGPRLQNLVQSQGFYEAMQHYRHESLSAQARVVEAFKRVKTLILSVVEGA